MEPIEVMVRHFGRPDVIVMASSRTEAMVKAAIEWGCSFLDIYGTCKLLLRKDEAGRRGRRPLQDEKSGRAVLAPTEKQEVYCER